MKPLESPQASAILIPVLPSTYYFIEYRTKIGSDSNLPKSGILIYYVNERLDSGKGILQLVSPETGKVIPAQEQASNLNDAVFKFTDRFRDPADHVFLVFLGGGSMITILFSTQEVTASILRTTVSIVQTSLSGMFGDEIAVTATLFDQSGVPISNQPVEIDAVASTGEWQQVGSATSDQLGGISFEVPLTYSLGPHSFRFFYAGEKGTNAWYTSSEADFSINIEPGKMILTLSTSAMAIGQSSGEVVVTDTHGAPLSDVVVLLYVNNIQQGAVRTDQNGKATFSIQFKIVDIGPIILTVKAGATNYLPTQTSESIFVIALWLIPLIAALIAAAIVVVWRPGGKHRKSLDSSSSQ